MQTYADSPIARLLTAFLVVAPVTYLLADILYVVRGWDDPTAAVFHVLGAVGYSFALLALVTMLDPRVDLGRGPVVREHGRSGRQRGLRVQHNPRLAR